MILLKRARPGAVAAIGGPIILLVATLLHPASADPNDPLAAFQEYAADDLWVATHLGQFAGITLIVAGLIALHRTLVDGRSAYWARLGLAGALASLGVFAVLQAVDGIALKVMVDAWVDAPPDEKSTAFWAAFGVRQIEVGIASMVALLFGATVTVFGVAITRADNYPNWLGWWALIAGIGTAAGGLAMAYSGFSVLAMNVNMSSSLLALLWLIVMGALMWRMSGGAEHRAG